MARAVSTILQLRATHDDTFLNTRRAQKSPIHIFPESIDTNLPTFLSSVGVVSILFGIGFIAIPAEVLAQYGVTGDTKTIFMSRLSGGALIQVGVLAWLARYIVDHPDRGASLLSGLIVRRE